MRTFAESFFSKFNQLAKHAACLKEGFNGQIVFHVIFLCDVISKSLCFGPTIQYILFAEFSMEIWYVEGE